MDLLALLVLPIVALLGVAIDVTVFFAIMRLLRRVWAPRWIVAFDTAGAQLIAHVLRVFANRAGSQGAKVREPAALAVIIGILLLARALLAAVRYGIAAVAVGG